MKIFVTGATGFIGTHLVNQLVKEGHQICINVFKNNFLESVTVNNVNCYKLNINKIEQDINFFRSNKFDGIIHLASLYLPSHNSPDVVKLIETNVEFSTHVLECACRAGVRWFINTGTFYQHYQNQDYSPVNLYAATKQAFECIAKFYYESNLIRFCTLRLSDTYGKNDLRAKFFTLWKEIQKKEETLDMSPGNQLIDITHVSDVVNAFSLLVKYVNDPGSEVKNGDIFAVRALKRYSLKELANLFESVTQKKLFINWGGRSYREREVMVPWDRGKIVPGWKPEVTLEEGINEMFN
jgi:nucleoside-diphosphate-sugar epimerase